MHLEQPTGRAALTLGYVVAGGLNLAFHLLAANLAAPSEYGMFAAIAATIAITAIPLSAMEVSLASSAARLGGRLGVEETLRRTGAALGRPVAALTVMLLPAVRYGIDASWVESVAIAVFVPTAVVLTAAKALLIGSRSYRHATTTVLFAPSMRLLALAVLVLVAGPVGAAGLTVATLMAECAAVAYGTWALTRLPQHGRAAAFDLRRLGFAASALVPVAALAGADVLMARAALTPETAGRIAAVASLAKGALYLPQAVANASLPDLAAAPARRAATMVLRAAAAMVGLVVVGLVLVAAFGGFATHLLLGDASLAAVLPWVATAATAVGLAQLSVTMLLARDAPTARFAWLALPVLLTVTPWLGSTVQVLLVLNAVTWGTAVAGLVTVARHHDRIGDERLPNAPPFSGSLTVVLPTYRPGPGFVTHLRAVVDVARDISPTAQVVVVDDACPEASGAAATALGLPGVEVLHHERNRGKGSALRTGFAAATGDVVVFLDADGDIGAELVRTLASCARNGAAVVVADKTHPESHVEWSPARRLLTFGWGTLVQVRHGVPVADTQVGAKAFDGDLARRLARVSRVDGFAVDLELLVLAHRWGATFSTVPVTIARAGGSSVTLSAVLRMAAVGLRRVHAGEERGDVVTSIGPEPTRTAA